MPQTAIGLTLLVLAGAMNGSFTLPMKFTRSWAWENTWLSWTFFALLLFPILLAAATVSHLGEVYRQAGAVSSALTVAAFGAGWGLSQIFLGLAVEGIGMALALSVIMGLSAAIGAIIPLLQHHRDEILTRGGLVVLLGLAIVLAGVILCGLAGRLREQASAHASTRTSVATGLFFCLISGVGSAFVNLGLNAGKGLSDIARTPRHGKPVVERCGVAATDGCRRNSECVVLLLPDAQEPHRRQVCRFRHQSLLAARSDHGILLVRKYGHVRRCRQSNGSARNDSRLAHFHVTDRAGRHGLGRCDRRMEARWPSSAKNARQRSCAPGSCDRRAVILESVTATALARSNETIRSVGTLFAI